ncbi:MAG: hypothetical protein H6595_13305 [Flavobacteriales bacterium]|nr:hypothetical protein [Flavobacteriales bacterium]MCB9168443.1 hypothetical protein [Flavobacteriales bacterium]
MDRSILTMAARMMLTDDGRIIEVRFHEGRDLDVPGLMEVQKRRGELTRARCGMLSIFPPGTLSELAVMDVDFFGETNANEQLIALAIVTADDLGEAMSSLYYGYHPQAFPTRIFRDGPEARGWLLEMIARDGV